MQITLQSYVKALISASPLLSDRSGAASRQEEQHAQVVVPAAFAWRTVTPAVQAWSQAGPEVLHSSTGHSNKLHICSSTDRGNLWLKPANTVVMTSFLKEFEKTGNAEERRPLQFSVLVVFILCTCHICQSV